MKANRECWKCRFSKWNGIKSKSCEENHSRDDHDNCSYFEAKYPEWKEEKELIIY